MSVCGLGLCVALVGCVRHWLDVLFCALPQVLHVRVYGLWPLPSHVHSALRLYNSSKGRCVYVSLLESVVEYVVLAPF